MSQYGGLLATCPFYQTPLLRSLARCSNLCSTREPADVGGQALGSSLEEARDHRELSACGRSLATRAGRKRALEIKDTISVAVFYLAALLRVDVHPI